IEETRCWGIQYLAEGDGDGPMGEEEAVWEGRIYKTFTVTQQHNYSEAGARTHVVVSIRDNMGGPYRRVSADSVPLIPCCRCGALWIRRFVLNRVGIWQDNCFKEIHCSAAISCRLWHRICDCG